MQDKDGTLASLPVLFFCASCVLVFPFDGLMGNGDVVSRNLNLSSFDSIKNHTSATVIISRGNQSSIAITVDENLLEALDVRVDFGTLVIATKLGKNILSSTRFVVEVTLPTLNELKAYGSGSISCEDDFYGRELELSSSGSADITGTFNYEEIHVSIVGSEDINYYGNPYLDYRSSGSGLIAPSLRSLYQSLIRSICLVVPGFNSSWQKVPCAWPWLRR
jgi:hypothetical protein